LRVDLGIVIRREESIAFQTARCHEDKDAEGCVAEAKSLRRILGEHANHQVDLIDVVVVNLPQFLHPLFVVGNLFESFDGGPMNQLAKLIVARHSTFAVTQNFCRRQVDGAPIWLCTLLQQVRIIVQGDRPWVEGTERIEEIGMRYAAIGDGYDVKAGELAESCLVDR